MIEKTKLMMLLCVVAVSNNSLAMITDGNFTLEERTQRILAERLIQLGPSEKVAAQSNFHAGSPNICQLAYLSVKNEETKVYRRLGLINLDGYNPNNETHREQMRDFLHSFRGNEQEGPNYDSYDKFLALIDSYDEPLTLETLRQAGITDIQLVMFILLDAFDLLPVDLAQADPLRRLLNEDPHNFIALLKQTLGKKGMLKCDKILESLIRSHSEEVVRLTAEDWDCIRADRKHSLIQELIRWGHTGDAGLIMDRNYSDEWFSTDDQYTAFLGWLRYHEKSSLVPRIIDENPDRLFRQPNWSNILLRLPIEFNDYTINLLKKYANQNILAHEDSMLPALLAYLVRTPNEDSVKAVMEIMKQFDNRLMDKPGAENLLYCLLEARRYSFAKEIILGIKDQNILGRLFEKLISSRTRSEISHVAAFLKRNVEMYVQIITKHPSEVLTRVLEDTDLARKVAEELAKTNREVWGETTNVLLRNLTYMNGGTALAKDVIDSNRSGFIGSSGADEVLERLVASHPDYVKELMEDNLPLLMERNNVERILGKLFEKEHTDFVAAIRNKMQELSHPAQAEQFPVDA